MEENIVNWSASATHVDGSLWRVTVTGDVAPGYHIYDTAEYEYGANPTIITIDGGKAAKVSGDLQVISTVDKEYDEILGFELGTISGKAEFSQDVVLRGKSADLEVYVEWMACTETECTPLDDITLTVHIEKETGSSSGGSFIGIGSGVLVIAALLLIFKRRRK
ncbi:MAG: LPXTG cell wall anchor domain-containing protein [Bacteroidales bacterium]|nr:LPXTG cell wall anchor domain-containing protein [Bacteroidales bacterium]